jgi:hypothetical protein
MADHRPRRKGPSAHTATIRAAPPTAGDDHSVGEGGGAAAPVPRRPRSCPGRLHCRRLSGSARGGRPQEGRCGSGGTSRQRRRSSSCSA